jgi:hypothetical protein
MVTCAENSLDEKEYGINTKARERRSVRKEFKREFPAH